MNEMIERVSRALDARISGGVTMTVGDLARIAIEAMREPTEDQRIAAVNYCQREKLKGWDDLDGVYRAMINAALSED